MRIFIFSHNVNRGLHEISSLSICRCILMPLQQKRNCSFWCSAAKRDCKLEMVKWGVVNSWHHYSKHKFKFFWGVASFPTMLIEDIKLTWNITFFQHVDFDASAAEKKLLILSNFVFCHNVFKSVLLQSVTISWKWLS